MSACSRIGRSVSPMSALSNRRVLVTGGLGFLGSSLCHRLVTEGCSVSVIDNLVPLYGGNRYNLSGLDDRVRVVVADMRDEQALEPLVAEADIVFHLAAQVSYIDSLAMPYEDLDLNARATLGLLELCRRRNPQAIIVFTSSRMVVGKVPETRLSEELEPRPLSLYGIHKLTSEHYLRTYHENFGIRSVIARITNPYGPRQQIKHDKYSIVGWFVRQAMEDRTIRVFGDGSQLRDYIYVDDVVEALLRCAATEETLGETVNLGTGVGTQFREMVAKVVELVGSGRIDFIPWPEDYEKLETGDVIADVSKLNRLTGWAPRIGLEDGIARTLRYYAEHKEHYV